jgi:hypothetical protein
MARISANRIGPGKILARSETTAVLRPRPIKVGHLAASGRSDFKDHHSSSVSRLPSSRPGVSTCSAARNFPLGLGASCRPNVGRPQSRNFIGTGDVAVEDRSFGDRSHLSFCPHGTTSGWLLAALGPEHGLRQHLVCLSRSATRWNSSRDLWRLSREHPERRNRLRLRRVRTEE